MSDTLRIADLIIYAERLVGLSAECEDLRSRTREFAREIQNSLASCAWTSFQFTPLIQLIKLGVDWERHFAIYGGDRGGMGGRERSDGFKQPQPNDVETWTAALEIAPFFALQLVTEEAEEVARCVLAWASKAMQEELSFFAMPLSVRSIRRLGGVSDQLTSFLAQLLEDLGSAPARSRAAVIVRTLVNRRAGLRYLFIDLRAASVDLAEAGPHAPELLAFTAVAPVNRLVGVTAMIQDPCSRELIYTALRCPLELVDGAQALDAEVEVKIQYGEGLLKMLIAGGLAGDIEEQDRLTTVLELRHYSASTDYLRLQRIRASLYDRLLRQRVGGVDTPVEAPVAGRIALIVSSLAPSAETQAIVAHYEALKRAGWAPLIIVWPHHRGQIDRGAPETLDSMTLDLADISFTERIDMVRACRLDCILFMNNLSWGWSEYIAAASVRLARVQIVTYLSVVTIGFQNLDYYLVGVESEGDAPETRYIEEVLKLNGSVLCFPARGEERAQRPHVNGRRPVLVSGATLPKLTPDTLRLIFSIAVEAQAERVIFYPFNPAWGTSIAQEVVRTYLARFAAQMGFEPDLISIEGPWDDTRAIPLLLRNCDLYVDAFPHSGGLSILDAIEASLPVIYRIGDQQRSRQAVNVVLGTGAAGLGLSSSTFDAEHIDRLQKGEVLRLSDVRLISDLDNFGARLKVALKRVGVQPGSNDPSWVSSVATTATVLIEVGNSLKALDGPWRSADVNIEGDDESGLPRAGGMSKRAVFARLYRENDVSVVVSTRCYSRMRRGPLTVSVNAKPITPLHDLLEDADQPETILIVPLARGWNRIEVGWSDMGGDSKGMLGDIQVIGQSHLQSFARCRLLPSRTSALDRHNQS